MGISEILAQIDIEIEQLQRARALLGGASSAAPIKTTAAKAAEKPAKTKKKRNLTPEGRKRIAEAVKRAGGAEFVGPALQRGEKGFQNSLRSPVATTHGHYLFRNK